MTKDSDKLSEDSLKAAIWYTVARIIEEEELSLGVTVSENFAGALTELVFRVARQLGHDLESFAQHANRTTINTDDVKLIARNNDALLAHLAEYASSKGIAFDSNKKQLTKAGANKNDDNDDELEYPQKHKVPRKSKT